jgi:transcriptional regulator
MYLPKDFAVTELSEIVDCVEAIGAADLITMAPDGRPIATLLPLIWDRRSFSPEAGNFGKLIMHMARANPHWQSMDDGAPALAIVHGPQAYISPSAYATKKEHGKVVPTWDYLSVHFAGSVVVTQDIEDLRAIVTGLTDYHESHRENPWQVIDAPPPYVNAQLHGIIGVYLQVTELSAKAKLGQNRSFEDRLGASRDLRQSDRAQDNQIADLIDKSLI